MRGSGGPLYFLRGALYQNSLWAEHREKTKQFLERWNPKSKSILLVGPSAGFSIPPEFLQRFENIIAIEPDPLARIIFEKRLNIKPKWIKKSLKFEEIENLQALRDADAAILFCNVLGQIPFSNLKKVQKNLKTMLIDQEWASYHDALSGKEIEFDLEELKSGKASLSKLKDCIYIKSAIKTEFEVSAHQSFDLFEKDDQLQFSYWQWRILPMRSHLIEGVFRK